MARLTFTECIVWNKARQSCGRIDLRTIVSALDYEISAFALAEILLNVHHIDLNVQSA